jgi:hypothetical protein
MKPDSWGKSDKDPESKGKRQFVRRIIQLEQGNDAISKICFHIFSIPESLFWHPGESSLLL